MSVEKFKVGDAVLVIEANGAPEGYVGQVGVVESIDSSYQVRFQDGEFWYYTDASIESTKAVYYVVDEESGDVTAEHSSLEAAEKDAKGSAEQTVAVNGMGVYKRIVVYKAVSDVVEERA